jgi:hypothetical protein
MGVLVAFAVEAAPAGTHSHPADTSTTERENNRRFTVEPHRS